MFVKGIKGELIQEVFVWGAGNSFKFDSEVQPRVEALLVTVLPSPLEARAFLEKHIKNK